MITLTMQDEKRLDVIQRVYRDEVIVVQAALVMGVSNGTSLNVAFFSAEVAQNVVCVRTMPQP